MNEDSPKVVPLELIRAAIPGLELIEPIEEGFSAYSTGRAVVPPVGELLLEKGEVHIKYGYLHGDDYYVIKIASGFYGNPGLGLPSGNGMMLLFSQQTGAPVAILLDGGELTDLRTAVAGAIAAKHLAPKRIVRIGILGTGTQARLQLLHLSQVCDCREVLAWGRGDEPLATFRHEMEDRGFSVETTTDASDLLRSCNLVVTTTPATEPLLRAADLRPGTHITAVGSDTPHKQELESAILRRADVVVADSIPQCLLRGEIHRAIESGDAVKDDLRELGDIISGSIAGRTSEDQITVADLTGLAVQDLKIAAAVYEALA
jgi:ornithine cyclodeaminase